MMRLRWMPAAALSAALALPAYVALAASTVTVPVEMQDGRPVVSLKIAGKSHPFLLDTGSNTALHLTPDLLAKVPGLKLTGRKLHTRDLSGQEQEADEFVIPDLVLNGVHFGEVRGQAFKPWGLHLGEPLPQPEDKFSVIGLPLFAKQAFVYDYSARQFSFGAKVQHGGLWKVLPYEASKEGLVVRFVNPRTSYRLVLDSASTISVVSRQRAEEKNDETGTCPMNIGPGRGCNYVEAGLGDDGISFQPLLHDLPEQFTADGIAGADFFQHYAVYIDQAAGQVAVRRKDR